MSELFIFTQKIASTHNRGSLALGARVLTDTPAASADSQSGLYRAIEFCVTNEYGNELTGLQLQENGITLGDLVDWLDARGPELLERFACSLARAGWYSTVMTFRREANNGRISIVFGFAHPQIAHHLCLPASRTSPISV